MDYYTCNTSVQGVKDKVNLMIAASLKRRQAKGSQDTPLCLLCHDNDVWSEEVMLENEDTCCYSVSDQQSVCQVSSAINIRFIIYADEAYFTYSLVHANYYGFAVVGFLLAFSLGNNEIHVVPLHFSRFIMFGRFFWLA